MAEKRSKSDLFKLIKILPRRHLLPLLLISVLVTLVGLTALLQPYLLKTFVDGLELKQFSMGILIEMLVLIGASYFVEALLFVLYVKEHIKLEKYIRKEITSKAFDLNPGKVKSLGEGYITKLFNDSVYSIMQLFTPEVTKTLIDIVKIIAVLTIFALVNLTSFFIILGVLAIYFIVFAISNKVINPKLEAFYEQHRTLNEQISEGLSVTEIIKTYPAYKKSFMSKFRSSIDSVYKSLWGIEVYFSTIYRIVTSLVSPVARVAMYGVVGYEVFFATNSIANLVLVLTYVVIFESSLLGFSNFYMAVLHAKSASKKLFSFLQLTEKPVLRDESEPKFFVRADNYSIVYDDNRVILPSSFELALGHKYNLKGENGKGKSSFIQHIMNSAEAYEGDLFLMADGNNLRHCDASSLFAYLGQDFEILNEELDYNITLGDEAYGDLENLTKILEIDHLRGRKLGSEGKLVSGGERRRINLARFFVRLQKCSYFIIDEAFISLDKEYLQKIRPFIANALSGKTGIIVSHFDDWVQTVCDYTINIENKSFVISKHP